MTKPTPLDAFRPQPHPLKLALKRQGVTQATAANFCGMSLKRLNELLNGTATPSPEQAARMDEALTCLTAEE